MRWLIYVSAFLLFISCTQAQTSSHAVGKYLYLDTFDRLHINKDCILGSEVVFLDTLLLYSKDEYKYCSDCFTDSTYDHVQVIMHHESGVKWLYEKFTETYSDIPSYPRFLRNLKDVQTRKRLFKISVDNEWYDGGFKDFSEMLGF